MGDLDEYLIAQEASWDIRNPAFGGNSATL
jgi:hypothetical protein